MAAFQGFKEAHLTFLFNLQHKTSIVKCREQFDRKSLWADDFCPKVQEWIRNAEEILMLNSQVSPEDSASQIGSRVTSKSSRGSQHSVNFEAVLHLYHWQSAKGLTT